MRLSMLGRFALLAAIATDVCPAAEGAPVVNPTPHGTSNQNTFFVTWRDPKEDAFQVGATLPWTSGRRGSRTRTSRRLAKLRHPGGPRRGRA